MSGTGSPGGSARSPVLIAAVSGLLVAAAILIPLVATGTLGGGAKSGTTTTTVAGPTSTSTRPLPQCKSAGCAVVNDNLASRSAVFYGASCDGVKGSWFLNVTTTGANDSLRPAYRLLWQFGPGASTAKPNGTVTIRPAGGQTASITISNGTISLKGTDKNHTKVSASGTITVSLTGSATSPTLTISESGLSSAEHQLGMPSPYDSNGHGVVVPVKLLKHYAGC